MKKLVYVLVSCMLLVSMINIAADGNDQCSCKDKEEIKPMAYHATQTRCSCDPWDPYGGRYACACRDRDCIRYDNQWHCGYWGSWDFYVENICIVHGGIWGCSWYH